MLQPGNLEKTGKKPWVFPPEFPGIPGEIPRGIFRETVGIRKETTLVFPWNLWRKLTFTKRILTKSPHFFRKSPGGISGGFLTGRRRKKFPTFFPENFSGKFSGQNFFWKFRKFPKSFLTDFFWKSFPPFFEKCIEHFYWLNYSMFFSKTSTVFRTRHFRDDIVALTHKRVDVTFTYFTIHKRN